LPTVTMYLPDELYERLKGLNRSRVWSTSSLPFESIHKKDVEDARKLLAELKGGER